MDDSYSNRITHVLCEHQKSDVFQLVVLFSIRKNRIYHLQLHDMV